MEPTLDLGIFSNVTLTKSDKWKDNVCLFSGSSTAHWY